ncbi:MAG: hypothetical protein K0S07_890 [Chlamydiales bacterium]|jgi:putative oxidoreductase|nr:hypothetical protein [Chlamydiales bacterium]
MLFLPLIGRALYSLLFLLSAGGHFTSQRIAYAASLGVPFPDLAIPLSGVLCFLGGLSILIGYRAKLGAWMLIVFLIPVTLFIHPFWLFSDPSAANLQYIMFLKNMALVGTACLIAHFGPGPFSLDNRK